MPTYDYQCDACGHAFEEFQSMSAKPLKKCPACGKNKLQRLIGIGAGVIFKGSGFYETDYRSDSYKQAAKKDQEASSGGSATASEGKQDAAASTSSGSSDAATKPAAKTSSDSGKKSESKATTAKPSTGKAVGSKK